MHRAPWRGVRLDGNPPPGEGSLVPNITREVCQGCTPPHNMCCDNKASRDTSSEKEVHARLSPLVKRHASSHTRARRRPLVQGRDIQRRGRSNDASPGRRRKKNASRDPGPSRARQSPQWCAGAHTPAHRGKTGRPETRTKSEASTINRSREKARAHEAGLACHGGQGTMPARRPVSTGPHLFPPARGRSAPAQRHVALPRPCQCNGSQRKVGDMPPAK